MSNTLSLATRLRAIDNAVLVRTIVARELTISGVRDFFDLAEAFLDRASVQQSLTRLDRKTLATLAAIGEHSTADAGPTVSELATALHISDSTVVRRLERPRELLLVDIADDRVTAYDGVTAQLQSWPIFGLPDRHQLDDDSGAHPPEPVRQGELHAIDRLAAERAFSATTIVSELLLELERAPARELAKGGIALPDKKRLAHAMSIDLETVSVYLALAERAHLVTRESGSWLTTEGGNAWLLESTHSRWRALAEGWIVGLVPDIRLALGAFSHAHWGQALRGHLAWLYPAGGDWLAERIAALTRSAELLGITANEAPSGPGAILLAGRAAEAEAAMHPLLPTEVENVYLQHDLSVVAPGPLTPAVDARLRIIADVENRALAATYRVSSSSLNRALASGESAATILEFLRSISLTGIPQPLEYLIAESSTRYGLIRVGEISADDAAPGDHEYGARSYLRADETNLLGTIVVDQNLAALGLVRVGTHRVVSRFPLDLVFWSLSDARYPVAAENPLGEVIVLQRRRMARATWVVGPDPAVELVERLRAGGEPEQAENDQAWLAKQLDAAVRGKHALTVSVTMPDGSTVDLQLEPSAIAGGRLRARDRNSDVERTLPLKSIAGIGPAL